MPEPTGETSVTNALVPNDVRDFLDRYASAIMRDQIYVDELPPQRFHPQYDEGMWRSWRLDHLAYLNELRGTVNAMPAKMLRKLTWIAISKEPCAVGQATVELFAECASRSCPREDVATAALFFGRLIEELGDARNLVETRRDDARASMLLWAAPTDPLRIGRDRECGYGDRSALAG
jgi:hypothetical protein